MFKYLFNGMLRGAVLSTMALCCAMPSQAAQSEAKSKPQWTSKIDHQELDNGFRAVAYRSDDSSEPFNLRLVVNVGSVDDTVPGIAHMVEHMVFRTNTAHNTTLHAYFDELGWKTGVQINAMTRQTETQFMVRTRPNDALDMTQSVKLLADIAFHAEMKAQDWQIEKKVILEEQRLDDSVASRVNDEKKRVTRHGSRYAKWPTIGFVNTIEATTSQQINDFYRQFYRPSNMVLIASGHFDLNAFEHAVKRYFGSQPLQLAPNRDYIELPLSNDLYIGKVQDEQGVSSAVTIGFRNRMLPKGELEGLYQRLQNYFLRKLIGQQVRASSSLYTENDIRYLSAVLNEPTNQRLTIALSAKTDHYEQGLRAVLTEVERLKQNGLDPEAFVALKHKAENILSNNQTLVDKRNFAQWEDKMTSAVMQNAVVEDNAQYTERTRKWLKQLSVEEMNARLRTLLSSPDQFIFYQLPGGVEQPLPTKQYVRELQHQLAEQDLTTIAIPQNKRSAAVSTSTTEPVRITWPNLTLTKPKLQSVRRYLDPAVSEWQLDNGNRLVWLDRQTPNDQLYVKVLSNAGYLNAQFPAWLAQTGLQIWQQSDLDFVSDTTWQAWQKQQGVDWSWAQKANQLDLSSSVSPNKLEALFKSFYLRHQRWQLAPESITDIKQSLHEQIGEPQEKLTQWQQAHDALFQTRSQFRPTPSEVDELSSQQLNNVITAFVQQPNTAFIVGPLDESLVRHSVLPYLANLPVTTALETHLDAIAPGNTTRRVARYDEDKASVIMKSSRSMEWTPERSFLMSTLTPIAQKYLKNRLRHQMGGVYRMGFEMTLDTDNQLRSELSFNSAPDNVEPLLKAASEVLTQMSDQLSDENYTRMRRDVHFAEQLRLQSPTTWLRRLALSYQRYDSPQYLRSMLNLEQQINAEHLQQLAHDVFPQPNQATLISLPKSVSSIDNLENQNAQ